MGISTADLYEASYYLVNGCELVEITAHPIDGAIRCRMTFGGPEIDQLQVTYPGRMGEQHAKRATSLHGEAACNLFAFRRAYAELSSALARAKKQAKAELARGGRI